MMTSDVECLNYDMGEWLTAFSTMRKSGVSHGAYSAFNITHYCGDDSDCVRENRALLCDKLKISDDRLILPRQTHGVDCCCVDDSFLRLSHIEQEKLLHGVDAIVTNLPRVCIGVSTADCVPVLLCDTAHRVVAAIHAGWRGTVGRIVENVVGRMQTIYSTNAADLRAVIAPSISSDAFEVGDEVYDAFAENGFLMPQIARRLDAKWHIDLWEANRLLLIACGVPADAIVVSGICTYNNYTDFFSARRLGINSGRIFNGIMIN